MDPVVYPDGRRDTKNPLTRRRVLLWSGLCGLSQLRHPKARAGDPETGGFSDDVKRVFISSRASAGYLEIAPTEIGNDGARVQQWEFTGGACQEWLLIPLKDDPAYFRVENRASAKVIDVDGFRLKDNGAVCQQWTWSGADWQRWKVEPLSNGFVLFVNKASSKVLDLPADAIRDKGAKCQQWEARRDSNANQQWLIVAR